jgi:MYXO-CTERM domain-containing protein
MFKIIAAAALAATSFAASAASVNLVTDGSFESTLVANGQWTTVASTDGWTSTHGIEIRNDVAGQALAGNGNNFAELDTDQNSSISQTLTTVAGKEYQLSFYVQDRAGDDPSTDGITYSINGHDGTILGGMSANWTEYTYDFFAAGTSTVLTLSAGGTSNGYGSSLDAIGVSAVPEAPSLVMLAAGLGLLGLARRRAQK